MAVGIHQNTSIYGKTEPHAQTHEVREQTEGVTTGVAAVTDADTGLLMAVEGGEELAHATSTMIQKNTEQYMEILERNGQTGQGDETESEEEARARKREIYKSLSSEEIAQLRMMQIDLSSVSLSDIQGLVNTMRAEVHREAWNQLIADVCDGMDAGQNQRIHENAKEALEAFLPEVMQEVKVQHVLEPEYKVSTEQMRYLLKNELPLTIANLYQSEYASGSQPETFQQSRTDMDDWLAPKLTEILERAGISAEASPDMMEAARFMVEQEIPLTAATMRDYQAICDLNDNGIDMSTVTVNMLMQKAEQADVTAANVYFNQRICAQKLMQQYSGDNSVDDRQGETLTQSQVTARRQREEIRLAMTQTVANRLVMADIHIDTRALSEVVKQLREIELSMAQETLREYEVAITDAHTGVFQDTMQKVNGLKQMPAALLGMTIHTRAYTIQGLYDNGIRLLTTADTTARASLAIQEYETLMTAPRRDMGDSIQTAFDRVDSLLEQVGAEVTPENQRAARILGYNQMEISVDSLARIRQADAEVSALLARMTPQAVVDCIRSGINPVAVPVNTLIEMLDAQRGDAYAREDAQYSRFLYQLERKGELSQEERESYIGIFRLFDKIQRQSGRDIGFVVKTGQELTLGNLLSAHRSNQAKGKNIIVTDETGMLTDLQREGQSISEQIAAAFRNQPDALEQPLSAWMDEAADMEYMQEQKRLAEEALEEQSVIETLKEQEIEPSADAIRAMKAMQTDTAGIYGMVLRFSGMCEKKLPREDGLRDRIREQFEDVAEALDGETSVTEQYDKIAQTLSDTVREDTAGVLTYKDIQALKQIHTGFYLLKQQEKQETYQVPVEINGRWSVMHIRFAVTSQAETAAGITITLPREDAEAVNAELWIGEQAKASPGIRTGQGTRCWSEELLAKAQQAKSRRERYQLAKQAYAEVSLAVESEEQSKDFLTASDIVHR